VNDRDTAGILEGFLAGEAASVSFIEAAVGRALGGRSLNLGDARADVQQETLRRLLRSFREGQFRGDSALQTYVYKVAHGAAIDHWRSVRRRREDPGDDHPQLLHRSTPADQTASLERQERRLLVDRLLGQMGPPCRDLLTRVYFDEATYAAIAAVLGKTEGAIKVQVHRCRQQASRLLRDLAAVRPPVTPETPSTPNVSMVQDLP